MRKLHPKINEAAIIIQSWVDAGMDPDTMRDRITTPRGIVATLCCEAAGAKPVGGSVSAKLVAEVAVNVVRPVAGTLSSDELAALEDEGIDPVDEFLDANMLGNDD